MIGRDGVARAIALAFGIVLSHGCSSTVAPPAEERTGSTRQAETDSFGLGTGRDLALVVAAGSTSRPNAYAAITANVATGASQVTVDSSAAFAAGSLVLLWQTTGLDATAAPSGTQGAIDLSASPVGFYELARVASVAGSVLTLTHAVTAAGGFASGVSQVVRIPEYTTVTVAATGTIAPAQAWDGSKGGIVAFLATGAVSNDGVIDANGAGFRAGLSFVNGGIIDCPVTTFDGTPATGYAAKGEGLVPGRYTAVSSGSAVGGRGNVASGAGGGNCHNAGGGGGGHAGQGGHGGHAHSVNTLANRADGGLGGAVASYSLQGSRLLFGGGGGAGDTNGGNATSGGGGGGAIFVRGASLAGGGTIRARGTDGANVAQEGGGGGGAGGSVYLAFNTNAACATVDAGGGKGGSTNDPGSTNGDGPGGGGAGGRVLLQAASGACPASASAGVAGTNAVTGSSDDATPVSAGDAVSAGVVEAAPPGGYGGTACTPAMIAAGLCGGCVVAADCPLSSPVCLPTHACVQCDPTRGDADCATNAAGPICDAAKSTCGMCNAVNAAACIDATPVCNTAPANDLCAACDGDNGAASSLACPSASAPACHGPGPLAGRCTACSTTNAARCAGTTPICDTTTGACAGCTGSFGGGSARACPAATPFCNLLTGACGTNCSIDADCGAGQWCNDVTAGGACQPRVANGAAVPGGSCAAGAPTVGGRACASGACDATANVCGINLGDGTCASDAQCNAGVCALSGPNAGRCVTCASDLNCGGLTPACDLATGTCMQCSAVFACGGSTPFCFAGVCVGCNGDFGTGATVACPIPTAPTCAAGVCGKCASDADCGAGHAGPVCDVASGACVTPVADAGADGGDAGSDGGGAIDAGEADTGALDAGEADTGALDAGAIDAGRADAGVLDAGEADAGTIDSGAIDAGATDSGALDGAAGDAGIDAGAVDSGADAGAIDSGIADAGADGGALDGGGADAGRDGGATDGGVADAGADAGRDGGATDGGAKDAGADAGTDAGRDSGAKDASAAGDAADNGEETGLDDGTAEGGGCSCRTTRSAPGDALQAFAGALALLVALRRRRARREGAVAQRGAATRR